MTGKRKNRTKHERMLKIVEIFAELYMVKLTKNGIDSFNFLKNKLFLFLRFYLFIHERHWEREAETQAEGEAGSMQEAWECEPFPEISDYPHIYFHG